MIEPAWLVTQAAPLVCGESGSVRDLEHVIWRMRLSVVMALAHWKLRALNVWTVEADEPATLRAERLLSQITHVQARLQT